MIDVLGEITKGIRISGITGPQERVVAASLRPSLTPELIAPSSFQPLCSGIDIPKVVLTGEWYADEQRLVSSMQEFTQRAKKSHGISAIAQTYIKNESLDPEKVSFQVFAAQGSEVIAKVGKNTGFEVTSGIGLALLYGNEKEEVGVGVSSMRLGKWQGGLRMPEQLADTLTITQIQGISSSLNDPQTYLEARTVQEGMHWKRALIHLFAEWAYQQGKASLAITPAKATNGYPHADKKDAESAGKRGRLENTYDGTAKSMKAAKDGTTGYWLLPL